MKLLRWLRSLILPPSWVDTYLSDCKAALGLLSRPFFKLKCNVTAACSYSFQKGEHFPTALPGWVTPWNRNLCRTLSELNEMFSLALDCRPSLTAEALAKHWPQLSIFFSVECDLVLRPIVGFSSYITIFYIIIIFLRRHSDINRKASPFGPISWTNYLKESSQL